MCDSCASVGIRGCDCPESLRGGTQPASTNSAMDAILSLRDCVEIIDVLTRFNDGDLSPVFRGKLNRAKNLIKQHHSA
jgi:hypothetical protein